MSYERREYDNTNRVSIFPEKNKREPKDRDYSGTLCVEIDGRKHEFWVNLWNNRNGEGMSGSVRPKDPQRRPPAASRGRSPGYPEDERRERRGGPNERYSRDDIPFD